MAVTLKSLAVVKAIPEEECTYYRVEVTVQDSTWHVLKRYKDFESLNDELVKKRGLVRGLLPPKIVINNRSTANVERRRQALHEYLNGLSARFEHVPPELLAFVQFNEHDVVGVTQRMAKAAIEKGQRLLESGKLVEFTPLQLHCVSRRLTTEAPTFGYDSGNLSLDIGHLFDFLYQIKRVKVALPDWEPVENSQEDDDIIVGTRGGFSFDLSIFKSAEELALVRVDPALIRGMESILPCVKKLTVHECSEPIETVLVTGDLWSISTSGNAHLADIRKRAPPWAELLSADFRYNRIRYLSPAFRLLVKVQTLNLSFNEIEEIQNLDLVNLTKLDLSHNLIASLKDADVRLGNISTLDVSDNKLTSLEGIGKLYSLAILDAHNNCIEKIRDVGSLGKLPCLVNVNLEGNPAVKLKHYREMVVGLLHKDAIEEPAFLLDDKPISKKDLADSEKYRNWELAPAVGGEVAAVQRSASSRRQHRLIRLMSEEQTTSSPIVTPLGHQDAPDGPPKNTENRVKTERAPSFRDQVESMRSEGGEHWLSIYNEMASSMEAAPSESRNVEGRHSKSRSPSRKRKDRKSTEPSSSDDKVKPTLMDLAKGDETIQGCPKLEEIMGVGSETSSVLFSAITTVFHPAVPWDELTTNEGLRLGGDSRIVTIDVDQSTLMEVNIGTGAVDFVFALDSFKQVTLLKRSSPVVACRYETSKNHEEYRCYSFGNPKEATEMFAILERFIESNSMSLASPTPVQLLSPLPSSPPPGSSVSPSLRDFFVQFVVGRCHQPGVLSSQESDDDRPEQILSCVETSCLPYDNSETEIPVFVILTDQCLHLVKRGTPLAASNDWVYGFPLASLRQVAVGLFDQSFRIEALGSQGTFSILTRDFDVTREFITKLQDIVGEKDIFLEPDERMATSLKTSLAKDVLPHADSTRIEAEANKWNLVLYMLLFEVTVADGREQCVARTLIITGPDVFLCAEDLVHWPLPTFALGEPSNPRYLVKKRRRVQDLAGLEIVRDFDHTTVAEAERRHDIRLLFDGDGNGESQTWLLRPTTEGHTQRILHCLKKFWSENFHQELSVFEGRHQARDADDGPRKMNDSLDGLRDKSPQDLVRLIDKSAHADDLLKVTWKSCLLYAKPKREFDGCIVVTPTSLHLLARKKDLASANSSRRRHVTGDVSAIRINIDDIARISVGLFDQYFRIEGDNVGTTFTCLTRDSADTNDVVSILRTVASTDPAQQQDGIYGEENEPRFAFVTDESLSDLVALMGEFRNDGVVNVPVLAYVLVRRDDGPKSIVVTDDHIAMFTEDHVHFPLPHFCRTPPSAERFGKVQHWLLRALKRVTFADLGTTNRFCLVFTDRPPPPARERTNEGTPKETVIQEDYVKIDISETNTKPERLEEIWVETATYQEREKLLRTLSNQWNTQMMEDLPMAAHSRNT